MNRAFSQFVAGSRMIMKAARIHKFGPPSVIQLDEVPIPEPAENEVLIKVHAAGVNPVDTYIREGNYAALPKLPAILGREAAGVIEKIGPNVKNLKPGDRVYCGLGGGGYAEYVTCDSNNAFPLPGKLSFSQGAGLYVPYFTAYRALILKCRIKKGETILVHGASGAVGIAAVQIAKAEGLRVVGTAGSEEGLELVASYADLVFNHKEKGYLNNAVAAIGGQGFDVVLENLANVNLGNDLNVLSQGARVAVVGSRGTVEVNPRSLMLTESSIVGVMLFCNSLEETLQSAKYVAEGAEQGWLSPIVAHEYSLTEASQAHQDIIVNAGARGKLVLKL